MEIAESERLLGEAGRWWELLPFTAHRIQLFPGHWTTGDGSGVEVSRDIRVDYVVDACGGSLGGKAIVDLGCLEGGFAFEFAKRGADRVLGVEARSLSVRRCELAKSCLSAERVDFVEADVNSALGPAEQFDVVFAAGILYHVGDPAALLQRMRQACRHVALICTHVAGAEAATHGCSEIVSRQLVSGTYAGRMFGEWDPSIPAEREGGLWASWIDQASFWPLEDDLVRLIESSGFSRVERLDPVSDGHGDRWGVDQCNRVLYLAWV